MARFEVTVSEMQNAANKIAQAAENFRNAAQQTFNAAQALSSTWEGRFPGGLPRRTGAGQPVVQQDDGDRKHLR